MIKANISAWLRKNIGDQIIFNINCIKKTAIGNIFSLLIPFDANIKNEAKIVR